jgi:hypothetical protein
VFFTLDTICCGVEIISVSPVITKQKRPGALAYIDSIWFQRTVRSIAFREYADMTLGLRRDNQHRRSNKGMEGSEIIHGRF